MPRDFNANYRLDGSTLYGADGKTYTLVIRSVSPKDYTVTDQNGNDVTKDFEWVDELLDKPV